MIQQMFRNTHEGHDPQITQMTADMQKRDAQTCLVIGAAMAVLGAQRMEHQRLVLNLRKSASSADK